MSNLISFSFNSHEINIHVDKLNNPWFAANDVCKILGYKNARDAVAKHCRQDGVAKRDIIDNLGRQQEITVINEGNLYRLTIKSRKPEAEPFESWVCDEVLPTIRKTGQYTLPATLNSSQQRQLQKAVSSRAKSDNLHHAQLWSAIKDKFEVGSYKDIPSEQFNAVVEYIYEVELEPKTSTVSQDGIEAILREAVRAAGKDKVLVNYIDLWQLNRLFKARLHEIKSSVENIQDLEYTISKLEQQCGKSLN